ncbi:nitroreductase family protein [Vibrio breoganii]|uniref:nitroreductase family protein n=1 Tax=Vibrio breoganii TaxID=553239 RepID=UPI000C818832|nr:nitroreductase family protein [Vibrio breoganii]PMK56605.1 nitroreductase [Vibrio breoganii]
MKKQIKYLVKKIFGKNTASYIYQHWLLLSNYMTDMILYRRDSTVFSLNTPNKIECQLILDYHSVEKGLLFENTKPRFARERIIKLHPNLALDSVKSRVNESQITVAYSVMCEYYELHEKNGIDISDYFTITQYNNYKAILSENYDPAFHGAINYSRDEFYLLAEEDFFKFSHSRKSIRKFTGEKAPLKAIKSAIQIALNTPSVCNRQASKVYLIDDKKKVDEILRIQGGMTGYTQNISQVLILTVDRNYFYTIGERNQFYIDGGMFLMNLLYGLHYNKIANCPANWGKTIQEEKQLVDIIELPKSEKIMCIVPIGLAENKFRVTLSKRRNLSEVFRII